MPPHPDAQQLIQQVEELSGRMVHVTEDPELKVMVRISTARALLCDCIEVEEQCKFAEVALIEASFAG